MCEYFALDGPGVLDIEQSIISEQLAFERADGDIAWMFQVQPAIIEDLVEAPRAQGDITFNAEAHVEVASSSTSAPIYVNEPPRKYAKVNFDSPDAD